MKIAALLFLMVTSALIMRAEESVTTQQLARQMAAVHPQNSGTNFILEDKAGYWSVLRKRMSDPEIATATAQAHDFVQSYKAPTKGELDPRDWTR